MPGRIDACKINSYWTLQFCNDSPETRQDAPRKGTSILPLDYSYSSFYFKFAINMPLNVRNTSWCAIGITIDTRNAPYSSSQVQIILCHLCDVTLYSLRGFSQCSYTKALYAQLTAQYVSSNTHSIIRSARLHAVWGKRHLFSYEQFMLFIVIKFN